MIILRIVFTGIFNAYNSIPQCDEPQPRLVGYVGYMYFFFLSSEGFPPVW